MTEFSINKETLLERVFENNYLSRIPGTNRKKMTMFSKSNLIREDDKTLYFQYPEEADIPVWETPPSEEEINAYLKNPAEAENWIPVEANELYAGWYEYKEYGSPEERRTGEQQRASRQKEALDNGKKTKEPKTQQNNKEKQIKEQPIQETQEANQPQPNVNQYNKDQFREIRRGLRQHLDVKQYQNVQFDYKQMRQLRLSLKAHIDVSSWASPYVSAEKMKELRLGVKKGIRFDTDKIDHRLYDAAQIREIRLGFEKGVMVKDYLNPAFRAEQMHEIRIGMQLGLDTAKYIDPSFTVEQMRILKTDMIRERIREIIEKWLEAIRDAIDMVAGRVAESIKYQTMRTPEQIKLDTMQEVVEDIKYLLVESELLPTAAYDDQEIEFKIKEQLNELVNTMTNHPEKNMQEEIENAATQISEPQKAEAKQELSQKERLEAAVDRVMEEQAPMEEVMEIETFEMQM